MLFLPPVRLLFAGATIAAIATCPLSESTVLWASAARPTVATTSPMPSKSPPALSPPLAAATGSGLAARQVGRKAVAAITPARAGKRSAGKASARDPKVASSALAAPATDVSVGDADSAAPAASKAVQFAMDQLGLPYVWGGAGPDSYDCSGLTMRAYESAGYEIPRVAADQATVGTPVDVDQLLPGDLLFYATDPSDLSTIHHVVMYIGDGLVVHAPHQGDVVRIGPMWLGDEYAGAVRIVTAVAGPDHGVLLRAGSRAHTAITSLRLPTTAGKPVSRPSPTPSRSTPAHSGPSRQAPTPPAAAAPSGPQPPAPQPKPTVISPTVVPTSAPPISQPTETVPTLSPTPSPVPTSARPSVTPTPEPSPTPSPADPTGTASASGN